MTDTRKPCEYCGADLPAAVDKWSRRRRGAHFANCSMRPVPIIETYEENPLRDALMAILRSANGNGRTEITVDDIQYALDEM